MVGWEVYQHLSALGVPAAYVDVDQLGMCYPERPDDPARHRLKARNVAALRRNFTSAGATCLIVSGVVDAARGLEKEVLGDPLLVGRLRADGDEVVARLRQRRGSSALPEAAAHEAELLDRSTFADWTVDTTGVGVDRVAQQVLALGRQLLEGSGPGAAAELPSSQHQSAEGDLLWLTGATGVGKSTVGFQAYLKVLSADVAAAFVDVDQLGFFAKADRPLRARNLSSVWANHHSVGAEALVVVGPVDRPEQQKFYEQMLPKVRFTWCRLDASADELARRLLSRRGGGSWPQPGDPLKDRSQEELLAVAERAIAHASVLERRGVGVGVAVDGLSPDAAAAKLLDRVGWPPRTTDPRWS